jgi:hypothetical protein
MNHCSAFRYPLTYFAAIFWTGVLTVPVWSQTVLVRSGASHVTIFASERVLAEDQAVEPAKARQESQRQILRESVRDLAHYLGKMSKVHIEIKQGTPEPEHAGVKILISELASSQFGEPAISFPDQQAFRLLVNESSVGLWGESDQASSYAIYELLHRLGCRWYMPSEMGEVIPQRPEIVLSHADESLSPFTIYRGIWHAEPAYARRNRCGGLPIAAGHALESYVTKDQLEANHHWNAEINGERKLHPCDVGYRLCWANSEVAVAIADNVIKQLDSAPQKAISLSPGDGIDFCECEKCRALDTGDWDSSMNCMSITDRYLYFANQIAARVAEKHPDAMLGFLAYVQFTRPPLREKVHPNLYPQVAPISYSRAHPSNEDAVPDNQSLRHIVQGWSQAAPAVSYYLYAWFLAESSAPFPMIAKWSVDVPFVMNHKCLFWQPEGITNFETSLHAINLGLRLAWNPNQQPAEILREINERFYGSAAAPMTEYWNFVDQIWTTTPEYSGSHWGYLRRFTPQRLQRLRELMNAAKNQAVTEQEKFRVAMAEESLKLFESFMKMRYDLAEGRFAKLLEDGDAFIDRANTLANQYEPQRAFGKMYWVQSLSGDYYFKSFCRATYADAARISDPTRYSWLLSQPMREWKIKFDPDAVGQASEWAAPGHDDSQWQTTDVATETWSTLGQHGYLGRAWYRTKVKTKALPDSGRVFLWLPATDGSAKVYINGQHVKFIKGLKADAEGQKAESEGQDTKEEDQFIGYAAPANFDITGHLQSGENTIVIECERVTWNEIGTGGLLGPPVVYQEKH